MPEAPPATARPLSPAPAPDASKIMIVFVTVVATLYFGREVLVPVTLALLLAFVLAPVAELLRRVHLGKVPSVLLGVVLALGLVLGVGGVIGAQIADLTTDLPSYVATVQAKAAGVRDYTVGRLSSLANRIGVRNAGPTRPAQKPAEAGQPAGPPVADAPPPRAAEPAPAMGLGSSAPLRVVETYLAPVLSPLATLGIVFVVAVFALLQKEDLRDRLIRLLGSEDLHRSTAAIDDVGHRLSRYFITQLSVNTGFGVVIGLGLLLIGLPNPVLWGILSALLRFVPYVGSIGAALLAVVLAAAVEPGWSMVLWTGALYLVVELLTGQVVEPMVYGHATGLSPFAVVVAAIFWSWLWGPVGLILSTPLTLCLVVMGRHVTRLQFLDVMLGDQPALTPVESFYQRILAGDADEAQDHAELLLKERSLSSYYDEVALKGLQLAARDAQRGVVDHGQLERIKSATKSLVRDLDVFEDRQPAPREGHGRSAATAHGGLPAGPELPPAWRAPGAVMCIAGRGPLDEAASSMLVQLLGKHGIGARLVGFDEASRDRIESLDVTGAVMTCISYLDISGSPAHLRYLVQRLRQRMGGQTPILVGLWPSQDAALKDSATQRSLGADYFTRSLAEAVACCTAAAGRSAAR